VKGIVRSPGIVTFVIDVSGSMDGQKLDQAKLGLTGALRMSENNQVGLLAFDSSITVNIPVAPLAVNRHNLTGAIRNMKAGACTALYDALEEAVHMTDSAAGREEATRAVVVLTDGCANMGQARLDDIIELKSRQGSAVRYSGLWGDKLTDAGGREVAETDVLGSSLTMKTDHRIQVYFIGIGHDADMEIGRMLAEATGAESDKGIELESGDTVERVKRVREIDIARILEEFKYF
jgi:secreted protein with Ig-like and vWFA domain